MKQFVLTAALLIGGLAGVARAADTYTVDPVHSSLIFRIKHANVGYFYGRINDPAGTFTLDAADAGKSVFEFNVAVNNIDTHNDKRDAHLKSPDFFNEKQYPTIAFKSTSVKKAADNKLEVTGDLTLHGVTKSIVVPVEVVGTGEFPKGTGRAGIEAVFTIKTSDFQIKGMPGALGEEVRLMVGLEGVKK